MSTKEKQAQEMSIEEMALALTKKATVKTGSGSGRTTYLDRVVAKLVDKDGNPKPEGMDRTLLVASIAFDIAKEKAEDAGVELELQSPQTPAEEMNEQTIDFLKTSVKCKNMVDAAVSNSNNSTAISYNDKYKDKYTVKRDGSRVHNPVTLELKKADAKQPTSETK